MVTPDMILMMDLGIFQNEAPADFTSKKTQRAFDQQLRLVAPLFPEETRKLQNVGIDEAQAAVKAATISLREWSLRTVEGRAETLLRAAGLLRRRRFELAAWILLEVHKNRPEADADVCEAIDFLEYYAREALRISGAEPIVPRGVVAVIVPWNFPLAILTGMTAAALVTGNAVLMKPAEQSPLIARWLFEILCEAGVPEGVLHFLPGAGEVIGDFLVRNPEVSLVAFTGSKEVGMRIANLKPGSIAEMGGKNALIVDEGADLQAAVEAATASAFGFQGQKCSACSRILLLPMVYDTFKERFLDTISKIRVGPPENPENFMGPVIDREAYEKIRGLIEVGNREARLLYQGEAPSDGHYIPPTVFEDAPPASRIATEEIFGPVVCLMKAQNLDEALTIANGVPYDLTGGFFSRSTENIQKVRKEFAVGNLYINRKITGALVACQPFGGYRLSSLGFKAGGPEYLYQFATSPKMPAPPPHRNLPSPSFQANDRNELVYIKDGDRFLGKTICERAK